MKETEQKTEQDGRGVSALTRLLCCQKFLFMATDYKNRILFGDALDVLKQMPAGIVQTCVTSPPYWGLRDYGHEDQLGLEATPEKYVARLTAVFREVHRVLKDDGTLWLNLGDSYVGGGAKTNEGKKQQTSKGATWAGNDKLATLKNGIGLKPKNLCMIPSRVAMALQADGWYLRSEIIWNKTNCMPESVKDRPTNSHEKIYLLSKSRKYYYDHEAIMEPLAESTAKDSRLTSKDFTNKRPDRNYPGQAQNGSGLLKGYSKKRNKRTVWEISLKPYNEAHFAVFPTDLITPCIKAGSAKGDLVLDPFIGSGTTAEVALKLGRNYLGIDLQEDYKEIQNKRLEPLRNDLFVSKTFAG